MPDSKHPLRPLATAITTLHSDAPESGRAARVLQSHDHRRKEFTMLYWAAVFFVIAIGAAILGFGGLAAGAAGIAKTLFIVFLVLAGLSFLFGRRTVA
jgi:uncharacterized membrane protein YtjA (UPF0391 family)